MTQQRVFAFGVDLPNVEGLTSLNLDSDQSLLDADVIVVRPTFVGYETEGTFEGRRTLDDDEGFRLQAALTNWQTKLTVALNAGKTIVYLLPPLEVVNVDTGQRTYSGTGRNRVTTRHLATLRNYGFIPLYSETNKPAFESGSKITKTRDVGPLATVIARYEGRWRYNCHFSPGNLRPALTTTAGGHCVSAYSKTGVVFLPDIDWSDAGIWSGPDWDRKATAKGKQASFGFRDEMLALHKALRAGAESTPPPDWSRDEKYALPEETRLSEVLASTRKSLLELESQKAALEKELDQAGQLRSLLFETGKPLERGVRQALELLGFQVTTVDDGKSEFDAVFESAEGRFIGEVEGREKAINVAKISQLRRNVDEDFARDDVEEPATGVLFGNGNRLDDPTDRTECFTAKVVSAAPALGIVLVKTVDLFDAAQQITQTANQEFAKQCRRAIADSIGEIVSFPRVEDSLARPEMRDVSDNREAID
jgi:hypothetical protein